MKRPKKLSKPLQLIILICGGIIVILISVILKKEYPQNQVIFDLLNSVGQALIIGPALSWILDLPSMINYFKKITIESLISNEYLGTLPREQLLDLRKECTAKIHLKDADSVEKGLINMDEDVCELLTKPYFERYRQNTSCTSTATTFVKRHHIEEYIVNPLNTRLTYSSFTKTYLNLDDGQNINDVYKIIKLSIKIDDGPTVDYTPNVAIASCDLNESDIHFNTVATWQNTQNNTELSIDYSKSILITRVVEVITPRSDITFLKRVTMPVKSLKIDYSYHGDDLRLVGSCFGTLSYSNDGGIKVIQEDKYISIESFDWLMPGNGIFVVKVAK